MRFFVLMANVLGAMLMLVLPGQLAFAAEPDALEAGVAKLDITPKDLTHLNPMGYGTQTDVHDPIFVRALVLGNGQQTVALVSLDLIETGDTLQLRNQIFKELGIPANHIIITASHDHSSPRIGRPTPGSLDKLSNAETDTYTEFVHSKILDALKQAKSSLQPVRMGLGVGSADVSENRDLYTPKGWTGGPNPKGPSDKTVWVLKFVAASGQPLAVLFNYAVHSTVTTNENRLSGDLAGAAEHYVEQQFGSNTVALWTLGPAGDQNPKWYGGDGRNRPADPGAANSSVRGKDPAAFDAMEAQGLMLGAEVVRVANETKPEISAAKISADERVFSCPLRAGIEQLRTFHPTDTGSVPIRLGVVMIGDIALATVSGEVVTNIYTRLRKASPLTDTILVTLTNDRVGYFVDDSTYDTSDFEVLATPAARGCAEDGIVNGLVSLIKENR